MEVEGSGGASMFRILQGGCDIDVVGTSSILARFKRTATAMHWNSLWPQHFDHDNGLCVSS